MREHNLDYLDMEQKRKFLYKGRRYSLVARSRVWYLTAMINGVRINKSTGQSNSDDAVVSAKEMIAKIVGGETENVLGARRGRMLWGQYFDLFESRAGAHVAKKHVKLYRQVCEKVLLEVLGPGFRQKTTDLPSVRQVENWKARTVLERGEDDVSTARARRYVNDYLRQVKAFTGKVWQDRLGVVLGAGYESFLKVEKFKRVPRPVFRPTKKLVDLTLREAEQLKAHSKDAHRAFWLIMGTGARRSELVPVKWKDIITMPNGRVVIQGSHLTKDGSEAFLPFVYEEAYARFCELEFGDSEDYIFGDPRETRTKGVFRFLCKWMTGIGWSGRQKLHALRAVVITRVFEKHGIQAAQSVARHKDASTTDKYIRHRVTEIGKIDFS